MNQKEVAALRELHEKAMEGREDIWEHIETGSGESNIYVQGPAQMDGVAEVYGDADRKYIVAVLNAFPELLKTCEHYTRLEHKDEEVPLAQRGDRWWMDMTPNSDLATRILETYIDHSFVTDNLVGEAPKDPLLIQMNKDSERRNELLRKAIEKLRKA
jgi:hypothetical protein